ncbi:MAG TPA: rod shape-determining protein RodA [Jatrophihabitantaceae bacterium]|jgi:rod shape determining protein RodA
MTLLARDPAAPMRLGPSRVLRPQRIRRGIDVVLCVTTLALALIGAVLVWSATRSRLADEGSNPQGYLYRHLGNVGIGVALAIIAARVDVRRLRTIGPLLYLGSLLGLLAVFAVGTTINGAHAWIMLPGGMELQPSEFMKLGLIAGLAVMFTQWRGSDRAMLRPATPDILLAIGLITVPLVLIMLQPDLGSAMVLAATAFGLLIAADVPARWTLGLIAVGALGVFLAIKSGVLADYQLARFRVFANPGHDPRGAAYNVTQARIAIANGGLFGRGLFQGPQTRGAFVPEQQTDFVYSVAGEEFGLLGAGLIIVLFAVLCWRGLRIAARADRTGRLLAVGVVCWFAFQAFQNIGMNLGLTPVTGLPLPFVSYGGSSMFAQSLAVGLLIAVDRYATTRRPVV